MRGNSGRSRLSDYLDTVRYLDGAGWSPRRIAEFLDRSPAWIEDLLAYAPRLDPRVRARLEDGGLSWAQAKRIARRVEEAPPEAREALLRELLRRPGARRPRRPLTARAALKRMDAAEVPPDEPLVLRPETLQALLRLLAGRETRPGDVGVVREALPFLFPDEKSRG